MAALAKYKYLGLSSVVEVDYPEPEVKLALWATGSPPTYPGLDRFGRVVDHRWIDYGASPDEDVARIQHGYDRNSNRLWRQNDVARDLSKKFDQQYTYDGLNRLSDAKTGLLNGSHVIPDADRTFEQQWTLDKTGNWSQFKQDDDGGGAFDLQQTRTANQVNEITAIGASAGPVWATPAYDPAGNTTSFPKPADPKESFTAVHDAWNRMVKVIDAETDDTVQQNVYDGRNYRITKKTYAEGDLDETRHCYFISNWRNIEERIGSSSEAERQFIWGNRYIDDLILRDRDTSNPLDGTLDERLYAAQDPNWNVTTIIDDAGGVQERYEYEAYGSVTFYSPSYGSQDPLPLDWETQYASYRSDPGLALYLARQRFLHPILGIWAQRDALEYVDSSSLYSYTAGSPLTATDPFGQKLTVVVGADIDKRVRYKFVEIIEEAIGQLCRNVIFDKSTIDNAVPIRPDSDVKVIRVALSFQVGETELLGGAPEYLPSHTACCCLKRIIENELDNTIIFVIGQSPIAVGKGRKKPDGTPGEKAPAQVLWDPRISGLELIDGKTVRAPAWTIIGHELCGHMDLMNQGTHVAAPAKPIIFATGPHEEDAMRIESEIRGEIMYPKRKSHAASPHIDNSIFEYPDGKPLPPLNTQNIK